MKKIYIKIISIINNIYPKSKKKIIFISSPDMSDNSFALFKYMIESKKFDFKYIWLIDNIKNEKLYYSMIYNNISLNNDILKKIKFFKKKSLFGVFAFISSKYVFFTHGFYTGINLSKNQIRINLWHGMPLKAIGYLNKDDVKRQVVKANKIIATSEFYQNIMSKVFAMSKNDILIFGQPRCDYLSSNKDILYKLNIPKNKYQKIVLWTPTYRYAKKHDIKDGIFHDSLPILNSNNDLNKLNDFFIKSKSYLIIKLHPMDMLNEYKFVKYSNIKILRDQELLEVGCQLYEILSSIDILLTDYSSIYIDFLLLNRPILFLIDDFNKYKKTRNFVFNNPKYYMPGKIVYNIDTLILELKKIIIENKDKYNKKREYLKLIFHKYNNDFSKRLVDYMEAKYWKK